MCVQNPSFCQDSVYMVSLASRSCLGINRGAMDSIKKAKSSTRPMVPSSHKKNFLPKSVSTTVKKHTASKVHLSEKKANCLASALKGRYVQKVQSICWSTYISVYKYPIETFVYFFIWRKLFDEAIHRTTSEKVSNILHYFALY